MSARLDELIKDAAPVADREVHALPLDAERELCQAIMAEPRDGGSPQVRGALPSAGGGRRWPSLLRRRTLAWSGALAAAATALALAGVSLTGGGDLRTAPERAWAQSALRVADAVPRLAIGLDGWRVVRADQFSVGQGEMTFSDGTHAVDLAWLPARASRALAESRARDSTRLADVAVAGSPAKLFVYDDYDRAFTALWRRGDHVVELRSGLGDAELTRQQFVEVLASLRLVGVDDWLAAMPPSVVLPDGRERVVEEMLREIPLPPGFDRAALDGEGDGAVRDRYQLGARVAGAVACGWIGRWSDARARGDEATARAAVEAMATARDWPLLREMDREGDYPKVLWEYADAIAGDGTVMGGKTLTVQESVDEALGC